MTRNDENVVIERKENDSEITSIYEGLDEVSKELKESTYTQVRGFALEDDRISISAYLDEIFKSTNAFTDQEQIMIVSYCLGQGDYFKSVKKAAEVAECEEQYAYNTIVRFRQYLYSYSEKAECRKMLSK